MKIEKYLPFELCETELSIEKSEVSEELNITDEIVVS
jgi:hypothetical protein